MKYKITKLTIFSIIGWMTQLILFIICLGSLLNGDVFSASVFMFIFYFVAFVQSRIEWKYEKVVSK